MENRKFVKFLIPIFILGFFVFSANNAWAYGTETHAYLTSEIFDFYNENFSGSKIPDEFKNFLIDGARREDDIPRWMNHFYDPVKDRGLTYDSSIDSAINFGVWEKSKDWVNDGENQDKLTYKVPATIASILNSIQQRKISLVSDETNFTWNEAIKYWLNGDKEKAIFTLGHVVHLIEDTSVPDHTRNDSHADGSFYEDFARKFNLGSPDKSLRERVSNKKPIVLDYLEEYFKNLATYSNNNFYSKDTIGVQSGYKLPEPDFINFEYIGKFYYVINKDLEGNEYYILRKNSLGNLIIVFENDVNISDTLIKNSYWNLLSTKSIQYGAGVIDLFFKEVEKAKNDPSFVKTQDKSFLAKAVDATKGLFSGLGNVFSAVKGVFTGSGGDNNFQQVGEVNLDGQSGGDSLKNSEGDSSIKLTSSSNLEKNPKPTTADIVITEIMYNPKGSDSGREWIEIFNNDDAKADLTGWKFFENGTNHNLKLVRGSNVINSFGYAIVADDANKFLADYPQYKGILFESSFSLSNNGETLAIKSGDLEINSAAYKVSRGANGNGNSLQFVDSLWQESVPTPGKENKILLSASSESGQNSDDLKVSKEKPIDKVNKDPLPDNDINSLSIPACSFESSQTAKRTSLIINEVAWMGTIKSSSDEWVELKNISNQEINLAGWQLMSKDKGIDINLGLLKETKIKPGGLILLERTDDNSVSDTKADLIYTGGIKNSDEGLRLFDGQCGLNDEIIAGSKWPFGDNDSKRTMERSIYGLNWQTSLDIGGTPKKENSYGYVNYSVGGSAAIASTPLINSEDEQAQNSTAQFYPIIINEIMYNPEGSDEGREWVEIYNSGTSTVDLTDWKFNENETNHNLVLAVGTKDLISGGYAVIADDKNKFLEDFPDFSGTLFESSFSLNNSTEAISLKNQDLEIDAVTYNSQTGADGNGKSLQLIEGDWSENDPSPGKQNEVSINNDGESDGGQNELPIAQLDVVADASVGDSVNFDASGSNDPDAATSSLNNGIALFQWDFGDGETATSSDPIIEHIYDAAGEYVIKLIVFDQQNASSSVSANLRINIILSVATDVVISELVYDGEGGDTGKEFIELYNPGTSKDLTGWSLRYAKNNSTTTNGLATFSAGDKTTIPQNGFLLIGFDSYDYQNYAKGYSSPLADINRSASLPNGDEGDYFKIILVDDEEIEIDSVVYKNDSANNGASFERKVFKEGNCFEAVGENEHLGNDCMGEEPFTKRTDPNPQNSLSYIEPRPKPNPPSNIFVEFDKILKAFKVSWSKSADYLGNFTGMEYGVRDVSDFSHFEDETTTTDYNTIFISEFGQTYKLAFYAIDKYGLESDLVEEEVVVPEMPEGNVVLFEQVDSDIKTGSLQVYNYYYDLKGIATGTVRSFEVYGESDVEGVWQGGICEAPGGLVVALAINCQNAVSAGNSAGGVIETGTKTLLKFIFPDPLDLDSNKHYALYLTPFPNYWKYNNFNGATTRLYGRKLESGENPVLYSYYKASGGGAITGYDENIYAVVRGD